MRHISLLQFFQSGLGGVQGASATHHSSSRRTGARLFQLLRSRITYPFHRSIRARFLCAFGLAVLGLVLMAGITVVSSRTILNTYKDSVKETRLEMMPIHFLQVDLREVDHAAYRHAVEGDQSAFGQYTVLAALVDDQIDGLLKAELEMSSDEHAHSSISLPDTARAWEHVKVKFDELFQHEPGTPKSVEALQQVHLAIDPVYDAMSEFYHLSMRDLQHRLLFAQTVGEEAFLTMFGAIVVGLGILICIGSMVARSILLPIAELQKAAHRLGEKDFSHRIRLRNTSDELGQLARSINLASATLQKLYGELEQRSTHDGLTGVLNRAAFDERLVVEFKGADRHSRSLSLLMLDIDFFKRINDTSGHQTGDQVLRSVARILAETTRPGDVVARYGGEEFAIILPESDEDSAKAMAERLRAAIEGARIECGASGHINLTVSIGCASRLPHAATPEALVKTADSALYDAKDSGRNRVSSARLQSLGSEPKQRADAA